MMNWKTWTRRALGLAAVAALGYGLWAAFQPTPVPVEVATAAVGTVEVTVDDDGRTRVRERYTISAPMRGRLLRVALDPGDPVVADETVVATFEPLPPELLDARAREEAEARLARATAAVQAAEARLSEAEAQLELVDKTRRRVEDLVQQGAAGGEELDVATRDARVAADALRAARFEVQVAEHERAMAAAALVEPVASGGNDNGGAADHRTALRSPVDGTVLRVFEESARSMAAGEPILEIGDTAHLEIVADYLSQDAVRVCAGMPVRVTGFGGVDDGGDPTVLPAVVRVVEPAGYTKVSALGVEEQRVDVRIDPVGDDPRWRALGDGFHVDLSIVVDVAEGVVRVPTGALFRAADGGHAVFVVSDDGTAALRRVRPGRRGRVDSEVVEGLDAGERVILYPSELIGDGTPIVVPGRG